jgi:subtilisin family serine protease
VAPKADIYAVRVFGCTGSTNVVTDAIEWAVDHNMDVINMSLGSPMGGANDPDSVASTNAARDGVIVIASSGNSGPAAYITGTPAAGAGAVSVAASDPTQSFPGAIINLTKADLSSGGTRTAIDANGAAIPSGSFGLKVIPPTAHDAALGSTDTSSTGISLGCSVADDQSAGDVTGKFIVVERGVCARVAKAIFAQQAGAAGVIMVNNSTAFPPFEGKITGDPDAPGPPLFGGFSYTVTIPLLGVQGRGTTPSGSAAGIQLRAANGGTLTLTSATIANPGYAALAGFSSWGPTTGDSSLKPNVTAPGVSIASAGMGTGTEAIIESGTSMAAPHTTGTAALVKQAHPDWKKVQYWEGAIENTADPAGVAGYATRGAGSGLIQPAKATKTQVVALGAGGQFPTGVVDFGFNELTSDYSKNGTITLRNFGSSAASFAVSDTLPQGRPHSTSFDQSTVTVPAGGSVDLHMTLNVPAATAGGGTLGLVEPFNDVSGLVTLTPAAGSNNGVTLRVPYYMVPQAAADINVKVDTGSLKKSGSTTATVTNAHGAVGGTADWYAWGIKDAKDAGLGSDDLLAVGAQSFPTTSAGQLVFAIATNGRWSNPAMNEFDIFVDTNNDGTADYDVVAADFGALTTGSFNGEDAVAVANLHTNRLSIKYLANAPTDSSTMTLPVDFAQIGLTSASPPFTYWVQSFGLTDSTTDVGDNAATYNAFSPSVSVGGFDAVAPGGSATEPLSINAAGFAQSPALGWLVVSPENKSSNEASLIDIK